MSTTTDKPTVEEIRERQSNSIVRFLSTWRCPSQQLTSAYYLLKLRGLKAENENLDETAECLQAENESLRNELGDIYARSLKETEHAN